ncbi:MULTISPECIES: glycine--tRNA ligase subunit beta [Aeromonas]|uniref:glycine--tRNA ligase subunit beta n=1 Tax=Aeromonas TaxID=642 RepID=UPI000DF804F9|nr:MULTISPECIES: glycine--tRNA ligase subunit beta [Aeromonas]MCV3281227.1 glycine--tRNA ligase subunit beta [Aeromonas caviae]RDD49236.1 glycine--tRNA ligase subunit beta [Aeromonas sp. ARM81]BBT23377.1 glycine--tRNA ligase beta subunit [Aeromonas caviae]
MAQHTFLVEIGTAELPPKALRSLAEAFADNFKAELTKADLAFGDVEWFASPRRLALKVSELAGEQPSKSVEKRGPAVAQAFDAEGKPTKAAEGWARGNGITVEQAERLVTDKGEWLVHTAKVEGRPAVDLLGELVASALAKLPIPKMMRWGDKTIQFVRPVFTVTLLLDGELVPAHILGIDSARTIRGHRFMGESEFTIDNASQYPQILQERGMVIADFMARKAKIKADVEAAAAAFGGVADLDDALLEEVTALVEWPVVLTANFEEKFLAVPAEALVHTMKGDQKYFPVYDKNGKLLPKFIFVTNIESKDPSQIISGNEKVVRPRLSDAEFFFKTDLKQTLASRLPRLETVLFQQQLGTVKAKVERIETVAGFIAERISADVAQAKRAGLLSKCDLMTNMVGEFTDTQGVMGMHYARHDGEDEAVAVALNEQYMPRFAGDALPSGLVACAVALADKFDTLAGIFGIGMLPKGDKDPFALRRAALGIIRIIVEKELKLDLHEVISKALSLYDGKVEQCADQIQTFILERLRPWYQGQGFSPDVIQAVLAGRGVDDAHIVIYTNLLDVDRRIKAVSHFRTLDAALALAAANKRVSNILAKVEVPLPTTVKPELLVDAAEKALATQVAGLQAELAPLFAAGDYQAALTRLAALREPVDTFFNEVMVMADDEALKANRLALLNNLRNLFLQVADISLLQ